MTKGQILSFIKDIGIVPVVRTSSAEAAVKAIEAVYQGRHPRGGNHDDGARGAAGAGTGGRCIR